VTINAGNSQLVISSAKGILLQSDQNLHLHGPRINLNSDEPPKFDDDDDESLSEALTVFRQAKRRKLARKRRKSAKKLRRVAAKRRGDEV